MIRLFGIYLVNKTIKYDEWRWICLRTVDFYIIDAWKSIFQCKNEIIQKLYSIGLWICLPWDFCASSWDHEIVLKTVRLERSALGWGEGCPMLWQVNAWHCIVMKILYESTRIKNKKCNEKLNKPMHKFGGVLDKYGGWGGGRTSLVWIEVWSFPILRSSPCSSAQLVFTHVTISSRLMLLFQGHVAKKCVIMGWTYVWSSSEILGFKLINNYSLSLNGLWVNSPWGWRLDELLTQRPWGQEE